MIHQEQMARTGRRKIEHNQASCNGLSGCCRQPDLLHTWVVAKAKRKTSNDVGHVTREETNVVST